MLPTIAGSHAGEQSLPVDKLANDRAQVNDVKGVIGAELVDDPAKDVNDFSAFGCL